MAPLLFSRRPAQFVNVPIDAFIAHLGMLAQKLIRQRQSAGIVFEVSKNLCLTFCVFGPAELPINQHQIVVGAKILWIDRQDPSKAFKRTLIITLDFTELAQLLKRYAI